MYLFLSSKDNFSRYIASCLALYAKLNLYTAEEQIRRNRLFVEIKRFSVASQTPFSSFGKIGREKVFLGGRELGVVRDRGRGNTRQ